MRVALPQPRAAHPAIALGADLASRRLIEAFRTHAGDVRLALLPPWHAMLGGGATSPWGAPSGDVLAPAAWDLLHDVRPAGDPRQYFQLRSDQRARFPVALTHHALCYPEYIESFFIPLLLAQAQPYDAVVCTSRAARRALEALFEIGAEGMAELGFRRPARFNGQLPVIPLGVDTDLYRPRDSRDVRHQLGLPQDVCVLLWLGRLSLPGKADLSPLIRAYREVRARQSDSDTLLVLVGSDGEGYGATLERYAAALGIGDHVRIERSTPQTPVHLWYSAADAFVSPIDNLQEAFGLATLEAMASGVPQVVSDWDGHRDTVVDGSTGFLVRTFWAECDETAVAQWATTGNFGAAAATLSAAVACDVGELADRLARLVRSPGLRRTMGAASRARALAEFAWPVVVRRYVECWTALVEQSARGPAPGPPARVLPQFFRAFAGYASDLLTGDTRVRLRPAPGGEDGALGPSPEPLPAAGLVAPSTDATERLRAVLSTRAEWAVDALAGELRDAGLSSRDVRRLVLWGLKHGMLEVA